MIPTSNHNHLHNIKKLHMLYIFWFLHQTTTGTIGNVNLQELYIFWFLHQTTTMGIPLWKCGRCISFDSYIKPQPCCNPIVIDIVVYLLIPTSNHNERVFTNCSHRVVYLLIPTSNHNPNVPLTPMELLYIFWFLHQTTTDWGFTNRSHRLYIFWFLHQTTTSLLTTFFKPKLYIFWFLHQTTTKAIDEQLNASCISFDSYIKPQPCYSRQRIYRSCISFDSYIKPQP